MKRRSLLALLVWFASAQVAFGAPSPTAFRRDMDAFVARLSRTPGAPPGFVVVAVTGNSTLYEHAGGMRDADRGAPMTLDTPIYNASTTKAYTGLLAAILDEKGVLPLNTRLDQAWPEAQLGAGVGDVAASRLLSHTSGLSEGGLVFRSVYTGQITATETPRQLARYVQRGPSEFRYSNFGPFVYSAMAEARTGLTWRDLLAREVLSPLKLRHSSARLEDFPVGDVARCHSRRGQGGWTPLALKPTAALNAAGGMYTSGRDTGRFLQIFLRGEAAAEGAIPARTLRRTWRKEAPQSATFNGLSRDGYGLGWDLGEYEGWRYVSRSGGYVGCRSIALFIPELDIGVAVLSVGDTGANSFNVALVQQALDLWRGDPRATERGAQRIADGARSASAIAQADSQWRAALDRTKGDPVPAGLAGSYRHPRLGELVVVSGAHGLILHAGVFKADLLPLGGDEVLLVSQALADPAPVRFSRTATGSISALQWDDDRFERIQ
ncbi:serine hydrolase domain-containing protein [Phenylobacterium deserti]|uniref:Beta-lactamase-related domain-containing protein n=1 Tax=Phenylobacterium deserti TaxID=1914756 RepID=A0A328AIL4_9CAUL|nr:serine hydrolase domain-containing protein [Phenylobacterium deserti]RAK52688.1 hypothetical protein DJ018_10860 [Phenylobacterium deserti]